MATTPPDERVPNKAEKYAYDGVARFGPTWEEPSPWSSEAKEWATPPPAPSLFDLDADDEVGGGDDDDLRPEYLRGLTRAERAQVESISGDRAAYADELRRWRVQTRGY